MKKIVLFSLLVFHSFLISVNSINAQSLIAHYLFNNNAIDASGNNNNGKIIGDVSPTTDRFGDPCGALHFNGNDSYIIVPNSKSLESITDNLSISFWFKIDNTCYQNGYNWLTILCKGGDPKESDNMPQFRLQCLQSPLQSTISINTEFTEYDNLFNNHRFPADRWNFFVLTYDGSEIKTYLNNLEIWKFPYNKSFIRNNDKLYIGRDIPGTEEFYCGSLDDLNLYSEALSITEIENLYFSGSGKPYEEFSINCMPDTIIGTDNSDCGAIVKLKPPQVIENGCLPIQLSQISGLPLGSFFPTGDNMVIYRADSPSGLSMNCYTHIIIKDNDPPKIFCIPDTTLYIKNSIKQDACYKYSMPKVEDNCGDAKVSLKSGLPSGSIFPVGISVIAFIAFDETGNTSECLARVIVVDSTVQTVQKEIISPTTKPVFNDSIHISESIKMQSCAITAVMYDDSQQDFDTVSVFFNGAEIVKKELLKRKTNGPIIKILNIDPTAGNEFIVKAWNTGTLGPNTMKIDFYEGTIDKSLIMNNSIKPLLERTLHSKPGLANAIKLSCSQ